MGKCGPLEADLVTSGRCFVVPTNVRRSGFREAAFITRGLWNHAIVIHQLWGDE